MQNADAMPHLTVVIPTTCFPMEIVLFFRSFTIFNVSFQRDYEIDSTDMMMTHGCETSFLILEKPLRSSQDFRMNKPTKPRAEG